MSENPERNEIDELEALKRRIKELESFEAEHKRIEESLRESEKRYRTLVENAFDAIYLMRERNYEYVNPRFCEITGYSAEELTAPDFDFNILLPEETKEIIQQRYEARQRGESIPSQYQIQILNKKGKMVDSELSTVSIGAPGEILVLGIMRDISERKQVEDELRRSEDKYRSLFEDSRDAIYISSREGKFINVNIAALIMFGYSKEEMIGMDVLDLYIDKDDRLRFRQEIERLGAVRDFEIRLKKKDGSVIDCLLTASVRRTEDGSIIGYQGIIRDVTEAKRLEEQFRQAQKMEAVGQLAGGVAHDFNNILTVISGNAEMAMLTLNENDPQLADLKEIHAAALRASDLTRQLLAFSRKQVLEPKVFNVNKIIENMQKMLTRIIGENIELVTHTEQDLWRVKVDPGKFEQVIVNLAVNARDAMPDGGKLTIETINMELDRGYTSMRREVVPGKYVMVAISDTGIGMTEEIKSQIFDPFYTTKDKDKGTGLGLSTVYGIIKQSGGYIYVYSELGQGTTLKIYLPAVLEEAEEISLRVDTEHLPRGTEAILLVEDEDSVRNLACRILKRQGYSVMEARNALEAYSIIHEMRVIPDLLVTDVVMPQVSGPELVERIKKSWPHVKVLFMSGYAVNSIIHDGMLDPDKPFLQKPFSPFSLSHKVREVLDADYS